MVLNVALLVTHICKERALGGAAGARDALPGAFAQVTVCVHRMLSVVEHDDAAICAGVQRTLLCGYKGRSCLFYGVFSGLDGRSWRLVKSLHAAVCKVCKRDVAEA